MATLAQVRAALAETLGTISAGDVKAPKVFDRRPTQINTNVAVYIAEFTGRRETQSGGDLLTLPVVAVCGTLDNDAAWDIADRFVDGDLSIVDHIDNNPSLGRDDLHASISGDWSEVAVTIGGIELMCIQFTVTVRH